MECGPVWRRLSMISWLFGRRITVHGTVLGVVGDRMVRWDGAVRLRTPATVEDALRALGKAAGADLLGALALGQPAVLLNGRGLTLPDDLAAPLGPGDTLSWLMPLAGG